MYVVGVVDVIAVVVYDVQCVYIDVAGGAVDGIGSICSVACVGINIMYAVGMVVDGVRGIMGVVDVGVVCVLRVAVAPIVLVLVLLLLSRQRCCRQQQRIHR